MAVALEVKSQSGNVNGGKAGSVKPRTKGPISATLGDADAEIVQRPIPVLTSAARTTTVVCVSNL